MIAAFIGGLIAGFVSSTPIGPINTAVFANGVNRGLRSAAWTAAGAVLVDVLFAALALLGSSWVEGRAAAAVKVVGLLLLLAMAWKMLARPSAPAAPPLYGAAGGLATGALLCATNYLFLVFWLAAVSWLRAWGLLGRGAAPALAFLAGVLFGDGLWFFALCRLSLAVRARGGPPALRAINIGVAALLLGFAAYGAWDLARRW